MKRLTTDKPSNNFETIMNFAYAMYGDVYLRYVSGEEDVELNDYLQSIAEEKGCKNCDIDECFMDCDCVCSYFYVVATQAAELRARLKRYEDCGEDDCWEKGKND